MNHTKEQLEAIVEEDKDKWASLHDLNVPKELIDDVYGAGSFFCYDAVNLVLENSSSTSGMYGIWGVDVSLHCTVELDRMRRYSSRASGKTLRAAFATFILQILEYRQTEKEFEETILGIRIGEIK